MLSERARRRIEQLLDEADAAIGQEDWALVHKNMRAVLTLDPENADALGYPAAERGMSTRAANPPGRSSPSGPYATADAGNGPAGGESQRSAYIARYHSCTGREVSSDDRLAAAYRE